MLALKDAPGIDRTEMSDKQPLTERVVRHLHASGYPELQKLEVSQGYERILLNGQLPTYFLKQLAQSLVLSVPEVTAVENRINVC